MRFLKSPIVLALAAMMLVTGGIRAASAQEGQPPRVVVFMGYDTNINDHYGYIGAVIAPLGHLEQSGWRVRVFTFGALFSYDSGPRDIDATGFGGSVSIGYQIRTGGWRVSGYVGVAGRYFDTDPEDRSSSLEEENIGLPIQIEVDYRFNSGFSLNVLASYTFFYRTYWSRIRPTFHIYRYHVRVGPEFTLMGGEEWDRQRVGAFIGGIRIGPATLGLKGGMEYNSRETEIGGYGGLEVSFSF